MLEEISKPQEDFDIVESVQKLLLKQSVLHQRLFRLLCEKEPKKFTAIELAKELAVAQTTIENKPPKLLEEAGLLARTKLSGKFCYTSLFVDYLKAKLPDIDAEGLELVKYEVLKRLAK